jgi:V8-like Glu-specific endopeptidase
MTGTARLCGVIAALIGTVACQSEANLTGSGRESEAGYEGAAGNPAPWIEDEMSVELEEAGSLEELLALGPEPRGVDLPTDLVIEKRIVRGDNRVRVNHSRKAPYSSVVMLIMTFPSGPLPGLCTGSMIAADAVLTAAHCVFDAKQGGFASTMRVVPGAYPDSSGVTQQPFGSASAVRAFAPDAYRAANKFWDKEPHDYAVVRIGLGLKGAFAKRLYGVMAGPSVARPIKLVGYHVDKCFGKADCEPGESSFIMHISNDQIRELLPTGNQSPTLFNHYADTEAGSSGSPIVSDGVEANSIFAVHVAGFRGDAANTWNMGVLLTPKAVKSVDSWMERAL